MRIGAAPKSSVDQRLAGAGAGMGMGNGKVARNSLGLGAVWREPDRARRDQRRGRHRPRQARHPLAPALWLRPDIDTAGNRQTH